MPGKLDSPVIKQITLKNVIRATGVGIHTGKDVKLTFHPSKANSGYVFKRTDLENEPIIEADINYVTNTERGTCLNKNNITIQTCEHVLASLVGLQIDNALIELNASEPPIMDGSSKFFVEALEKAGIQELEEKRKELEELLSKRSNPFPRAENFSVHELIDPIETRPKLISWIEIATKTQIALKEPYRTSMLP